MAACAAFAFLAYRFDHLAHVRIVWSGWLPILLAAILLFAEKPTRRRAALFAAAPTMNGLTNIHWLLLGSLAALLGFAVAWFLAIANSRFDSFTESFATGAPPWRIVAIALALGRIRAPASR